MTLRDRYCGAVRDSIELFDHWVEWRDWHSIELTNDEIEECQQEAEALGITLADCEGWELNA